jgi:hypothetical protein
MKGNLILWAVAFFITVSSAVYQRVTGPTYPVHGMVSLGGKAVSFTFLRSEGQRNAEVNILQGDTSVTGWVEWRKLGDEGSWTRVPMVSRELMLFAELPVQPPAGKLQYRVFLERGGQTVALPVEGPVRIRFKGDVPLWVLVPHILLMFVGMLLSTRAGLEFFSAQPSLKTLTFWTLGFLILGGLVFGPIMQKYAFDSYWTGWPFGGDLTDNKTAVAVLAWVAAARALSRSKRPARWALAAAIIVLVVFLIPHSLLGS